MPNWPVQDAKARFSEFLDACVSKGARWSSAMVSKRLSWCLSRSGDGCGPPRVLRSSDFPWSTRPEPTRWFQSAAKRRRRRPRFCASPDVFARNQRCFRVSRAAGGPHRAVVQWLNSMITQTSIWPP